MLPFKFPLTVPQCISSPGHCVHLQGSSEEAPLPGGHGVLASALLLRHVCWELEKSPAHIQDEEPWLQSPQGQQKSTQQWLSQVEKTPCLGQSQGLVAKAFLGACERTVQANPSVAKAGGGSKELAGTLARRGCESEASPGEPGITHHSAHSYSNTERQANQSF